MLSFWLELVTYLERYSSVMCEKLRIKPNVHSMFSLVVIFVCSWVLVYNCWTVFGISKRLIEFDPIGIE